MDFSPNFVVPETSHPKHPWQLVQPKCFLLLSCLTLFCPSRIKFQNSTSGSTKSPNLWLFSFDHRSMSSIEKTPPNTAKNRLSLKVPRKTSVLPWTFETGKRPNMPNVRPVRGHQFSPLQLDKQLNLPCFHQSSPRFCIRSSYKSGPQILHLPGDMS